MFHGAFSLGDSTGYFTGWDSYAYGLSVSQHIFNGLSDYNNLRSSTVSYNNARANLTNKEKVRVIQPDLYSK